MGRLLATVLGLVARFEADLIRLRTPEGMVITRAQGTLNLCGAALPSVREVRDAVCSGDLTAVLVLL